MLCTRRIVFKWFGAILMLVTLSVYATSVGLDQWVTTNDNSTWGLWRWCDANSNKTCHLIERGDSPGYFERVRGLAVVTGCVHLFHIVLSLLTTKCWPACITMLLYYASLFSTLAVMGTGYKTDHRWKDLEPKLGMSFWIAALFGVINLVCFVMLGVTREAPCIPPHPPSLGQRRCRLCCCVGDPALPTVTRRPSNASSLSIQSGKGITIFHSQTSNLSSIETGQSNPSFHPQTSDLSGIVTGQSNPSFHPQTSNLSTKETGQSKPSFHSYDSQPPGSHVTSRAVSGKAPDGAERKERGSWKTEQPFPFSSLS